MNIDMTRAFVHRNVLHRTSPEDWSVQGFGMMRTYLDPERRFRVQIWDRRLQVPEVSLIHDHPWDFQSWILSGRLYNQRYVASTTGDHFYWMTIQPGEEGGPKSTPSLTRLWSVPEEMYLRGDTYHQRSTEIHKTSYMDGTVSINDRQNKGPDVARVFWKEGDWVDANPRPPTRREWARTIELALLEWEA